jgi:sec-independent protein translocase protein TatA
MPSREVARFRRFAAFWRFVPRFAKGAAMGIGHWELMIIGVVIVLLFGHRLPSVMQSLGQGIRMFKDGFRGEESSSASDSSIHR